MKASGSGFGFERRDSLNDGLLFQYGSPKALKFAADLLRRQIATYHFGDFMFTFISDMLAETKKTNIVSSICTIIILLVTCFLGMSTAYLGVQAESPGKNFVIAFREFLVIPITFSFDQIFAFIPLYIELVVLLLCILTYIWFALNLREQFQRIFIQDFCRSFCITAATTLAFYNVGFSVSALIVYTIELETRYLGLFALSVISLPALCLGSARAIGSPRLVTNPMTNASIKRATTWCFCMAGICGAHATCTYMYSLEGLIFLLVLIFTAGLYMIYSSWSRVIFVTPVTQITTKAVSMIIPFASMMGMVATTYDEIDDTVFICVMWSFFSVIIIFTVAFTVMSRRVACTEADLFQIAMLEKMTAVDVERMYAGTDPRCALRLSKVDTVQEVMRKFQGDPDLIVFVLRYMLECGNDISFVFESTVKLIMQRSVSMLASVQLLAMIETSSERVLMSETQATMRQRQMDTIMAMCYDAQYDFWQAVLRSTPVEIIYGAAQLNKAIKNAKSYFSLMGIDEHRNDRYGIRYIEFMNDVSCEMASIDVDEIRDKHDTLERTDIALAMSLADPEQEGPTVAQHVIGRSLSTRIMPVDDGLKGNFQLDSSPVIQLMRRAVASVDGERLDIARAAMRSKPPRNRCFSWSFMIVFMCCIAVCISSAVVVVIEGWDVIDHDDPVDPIIDFMMIYYSYTYRVLWITVDKRISVIEQSEETVAKLDAELDEVAKEFSESEWVNTVLGTSIVATSFQLMRRYLRTEYDTLPVFYEEQFDEVSLVDTFTGILNVSTKLVQAITEEEAAISDLESNGLDLVTMYTYQGAIFFVMAIIVIYLIVERMRVMKQVALQPLLIQKSETARVYDRFLGLRSKRKSPMNFGLVPPDVANCLKLILAFLLCVTLNLFLPGTSSRLLASIGFVYRSAFNLLMTAPVMDASFYSLASVVIDTKNSEWVLGVAEELQYCFWGLGEFGQGMAGVTLETLSSRRFLLSDTDLQRISDMRFYPFSNASVTTNFLEGLRIMGNSLVDIDNLYKESLDNEMFSSLTHIYESYTSGVIVAMQDSLKREFSDTRNGVLSSMVCVLIIIIACEILLTYWAYRILAEVESTCAVMTRICTMLPDKSPFTELTPNGEVDFFRHTGEVKAMELVKALPMGVAFTDNSGHITYANTALHDMIPDLESLESQIATVSDIEVELEGETKFFEIRKYTSSHLPADEFGRRVRLDGTCYLVTDVTINRGNELQLQQLLYELEQTQGYLTPPTIRALQQSSFMLLDRFTVVEVSLVPDAPYEVFEDLRESVEATSHSYSTLLVVSNHRWSFFAVFNGFASHGNARQYIFDGYDFASDVLRVAGTWVRVSVIAGDHCLCRIDGTDLTNLMLYSPALLKASKILRCCEPGRIVSEQAVMRYLRNKNTEILEAGTVQISGIESDFCVVAPTDLA